jgi:hypothetical protein
VEKVRSLKERMVNMEQKVKKERMEVEKIVGMMEERLWGERREGRGENGGGCVRA